MKKTDLTILTNLRVSGRMPLTDLSRKTGLPVSTLHERLKQHVQHNLARPSLLLNFEKIGFGTRAHILLAVEHSHKDKLFHHLRMHQNVNSLFRVNNGWNIMMECIFRDMYSLENFVEQLQQQFPITNKEVHYVLDELKREQFLSDSHLAEGLFAQKDERRKA